MTARTGRNARASDSCPRSDYDDYGHLWRQWQEVDGKVKRQGKTKALRYARGAGQNRHRLKELVYDGLDQVVGANRANEDLEWIYDEIGNWLRFENSETGTQDRSHNDLNQITGIADTPPPNWENPVYDGDGRTTLSPRADDPTKGYHHVYDAWGRIVETWIPNPLYPGEKRRILRHYFDARGHRVRTQVHDPANGKLRYTDDFVYDEQWRAVVVVRRDPIPDSDGELSDPYIQRQFLWTPTSEYTDTLVRQDTRTTPGSDQFQEQEYALQDNHANTIAAADSSGPIIRRWTYEPFGKANWLDASFNAVPGAPEDWSVLFSGYRIEENTGLYQVRHRTYDPNLGRWLSRDPIGERGGVNLYRFAVNDGINKLDFMGLRGVLWPTIRFLGDPSNIDWTAAASNPSDWVDYTYTELKLVEMLIFDNTLEFASGPSRECTMETASWEENGLKELIRIEHGNHENLL